MPPRIHLHKRALVRTQFLLEVFRTGSEDPKMTGTIRVGKGCSRKLPRHSEAMAGFRKVVYITRLSGRIPLHQALIS